MVACAQKRIYKKTKQRKFRIKHLPDSNCPASIDGPANFALEQLTTLSCHRCFHVASLCAVAVHCRPFDAVAAAAAAASMTYSVRPTTEWFVRSMLTANRQVLF